MVNKYYRKWVSVLYLPVIPLEVLDRFYECDECNSAFNENIRDILKKEPHEIKENQKEYREIYAKALIATMTHMALIDDEFALAEEIEIKASIVDFKEFEAVLESLHRQVKENGNANNIVFSLLSKAKSTLSSEALMGILAKATVILLADGVQEDKEKQLLKEYLKACGLPKEMYSLIIKKCKDQLKK